MKIPSFLKKQYYPLNTVEISQKALLRNYSYLSNLAKDMQIAPVLKSNAYGHGLLQVAKILDQVSPPFFSVDSIYEAYELLKNHVKTKILIMGYVNPENLKVKKLPFSYVVYEKGLIEVISKYQPHAGVHIFVDTGMHREGIDVSALPALLAHIKKFNNIRVEGIMSHFAESERYESKNTQQQVRIFQVAQDLVRKAGFSPQWTHMGNSSASLHSSKYNGKIGNLVRAGIAMYGIDPKGKNTQLQPVLQFISTLAQIKDVRKGEKIGYSFTYTAKKEMRIGILPVGYYDGVDRRFSSMGFVQIRGTLCHILGRVSMNLTAIDVGNVKAPQIGERVIIFSSNRSDKNSVNNAAKMCETIPYDLLVRLASSTRRIVV